MPTAEELRATYVANSEEAAQAGYSYASQMAAGNAAAKALLNGVGADQQRRDAIEAAVYTEELVRSGVIKSTVPSSDSTPSDISAYTPTLGVSPVGIDESTSNDSTVTVQAPTDNTKLTDLLTRIAVAVETIASNFASREGFMAYQATVPDTTPIRVVPYNPSRRSLILRNLGAGAIYIGPDQSVSVQNGQVVLPYDVVDVTNDASPIWCVSLSGPQIVSVLQE